MKVAQVCHRFYPDIGGVETHVYEISKRLANHFEVEVLTTDPTGKLPKVEKIDEMIVKRFKSFAPSNAYFFSISLYKFLKRHSSEYDVIHAHNYHAFPALYVALTKDRNKFIFTPHYHGRGHSFFKDILHKPYKIIGREIFEKADAVICVSKFEKDLILKNFDISESNVFVIPNGVNLDEFKDVDKIKKDKQDDKKRLLYVGRIEKYKGLDYVIKALRFLPENFILEIVGKGSYKPKIIKLAKDLGVIGRIRFYQNLDRGKLIEMYAKADVLVLLSKYEAYGLVVAEALAAKTPCIVANTSALKEWVDNKNVFGVDYPINIIKLVDIINYTINNKKINVNNKKIMSWDSVVKEIVKIIENFRF